MYTELPDAPAEVQVEAGPQHGTLLVMWLPVKITERSCTAAITGYSVYVDGRRVKDLQSPTGTFRLLLVIITFRQDTKYGTVYNARAPRGTTMSVSTSTCICKFWPVPRGHSDSSITVAVLGKKYGGGLAPHHLEGYNG